MIKSLPDKLLRAIKSGKAILFTGAGFTDGCTNFLGKNPPRAKDLAHKIADLGKFEKDSDLAYVANRYLKQNIERSELIDLLKNTYTIRSTETWHNAICALPWMRCYTTNYDNSIEVAGQAIGKRYATACVGIPPSEYPKTNLVVHINGSILELTQKTLETTFKLSESSYNSPEGFLKSPWFHNFKNDIGRCSAIVFVGYSLYDIDIKRLIASYEDLNTYFVTKEDVSSKEEFTFNSYGDVVKCGVAGFGELIADVEIETGGEVLTALAECVYSHKNARVKDADLERLFVFGSVDDNLVESSVVGDDKWNYLFKRSCLDDVEKNISKHNIVIISELGNGKTTFLKELAPYLLSKSHLVYTIEDQFGDIYADIEYLVKKGKHFALLIDDYYRDAEVIRYLASNYSINDITIIATSRSTFHHKEIANLRAWGFEYVQYSLDYLDENELKGLVSLADSMGHWGELAGMPPHEKINWIKYKNDASLAYFLLSLFDSEDIKGRFEKNLKAIVATKEFKNAVFAIAILKIANIPTITSLISETSGNDSIYKSALRNDHNFQSLFSLDKSGAVAISSVFATYILKSQFSSAEIKDKFLGIAEDFNAKGGYSRYHELLFKHVLKFSSLERILKDKAKINTMASYYDELKRRVPWLVNDPHYWLQYGMVHLAYANFDKARKLFETAYALAANRSGYHTDQIDTQQARLLLNEYIQSTEPNDNFGMFEDAHRLLVSLDDDRYKFKQIDLYRDVIVVHYPGLSKAKKAKLRQFCLAVLNSNPTSPSSGYLEQDFIDRVMARLRETFDQQVIKGNNA